MFLEHFCLSLLPSNSIGGHDHRQLWISGRYVPHGYNFYWRRIHLIRMFYVTEYFVIIEWSFQNPEHWPSNQVSLQTCSCFDFEVATVTVGSMKVHTTRISEIAEIKMKEIPEPKRLEERITCVARPRLVRNGTGEIIWVILIIGRREWMFANWFSKFVTGCMMLLNSRIPPSI